MVLKWLRLLILAKILILMHSVVVILFQCLFLPCLVMSKHSVWNFNNTQLLSFALVRWLSFGEYFQLKILMENFTWMFCWRVEIYSLQWDLSPCGESLVKFVSMWSLLSLLIAIKFVAIWNLSPYGDSLKVIGFCLSWVWSEF